MQVPAAIVAKQVLTDGGSAQQAWVAAALVSGIESNGDPTDKNPSSTACGLFQFLDTTWAGFAGYSSACSAPWQTQVQYFVQESAGNNFYPWVPDLGGSYNGNRNQAAATTPQPGSPVALKISDLAASDKALSTLLGNVPTNWIGVIAENTGSAGGVQAGPPTPNPLVNAPSGVAGAPSIPNPLSWADALGTWADALGTLLTDLLSAAWWKRVGLFVLGLGLVGGGIVLFISTTKTGQKVESDAAMAAVAA